MFKLPKYYYMFLMLTSILGMLLYHSTLGLCTKQDLYQTSSVTYSHVNLKVNQIGLVTRFVEV